MRAGHHDDADIENVAEEIGSLGRSQAGPLESCYRLIAADLLVLFQPERFTRDWQGTIVREGFNAAAYLEESPSLKPRRAEISAEAYVEARRLASAETGLIEQAFQSEAPFTLDQLSSETYQPWASLADPSAPDA